MRAILSSFRMTTPWPFTKTEVASKAVLASQRLWDFNLCQGLLRLLLDLNKPARVLIKALQYTSGNFTASLRLLKSLGRMIASGGY